MSWYSDIRADIAVWEIRKLLKFKVPSYIYRIYGDYALETLLRYSSLDHHALKYRALEVILDNVETMSQKALSTNSNKLIDTLLRLQSDHLPKIINIIKRIGNPAAPKLVSALETGSYEVRMNALLVLDALPGLIESDTIKKLIPMFSEFNRIGDDQEKMVKLIRRVLGKYSNPQDILIEVAHSKADRELEVFGFKKIPGSRREDQVSYLIAALTEEKSYMGKSRIAMALGYIGSESEIPEAVEPLLGLLKHIDDDSVVACALIALELISRKVTIERLDAIIALLKSESPAIFLEVKNIILANKERAMPLLVRLIESEDSVVRMNVCRVLDEIPEFDKNLLVKPLVDVILFNKKQKTAFELLKGLHSILLNDSQIKSLVRLLSSDSNEVLSFGFVIISTIGKPAIPELRDQLLRAFGENNYIHRQNIMAVLSGIGDERAEKWDKILYYKNKTGEFNLMQVREIINDALEFAKSTGDQELVGKLRKSTAKSYKACFEKVIEKVDKLEIIGLGSLPKPKESERPIFRSGVQRVTA